MNPADARLAARNITRKISIHRQECEQGCKRSVHIGLVPGHGWQRLPGGSCPRYAELVAQLATAAEIGWPQ